VLNIFTFFIEKRYPPPWSTHLCVLIAILSFMWLSIGLLFFLTFKQLNKKFKQLKDERNENKSRTFQIGQKTMRM
jgi:threonine/homoserine/homoserine lactone efflux protein